MKKYALMLLVLPLMLVTAFSNTRESRKKDFVDACKEGGDAQFTATEERKAFHEYCDCAGEKISNKFTEADWKKLEKLGKEGGEEAAKKMMMPIIQPCLDELQRRIATLQK